MKRLLLPGAAGYLGSVLTGRILERGYDVTALDNLMYGQTSLHSYASHPRFRFVRGDAMRGSSEISSRPRTRSFPSPPSSARRRATATPRSPAP